MKTYECEIAVVGGSLGGVAAALAALEAGRRVVLTEATDWLGGQMTSQGVSALDEHAFIETFGGTRRYFDMRERVRAFYRNRYGVSATMPNGVPLDPGNGWVSRLCFEPRVGVMVLKGMLAPFINSGRLRVLLERSPVAAEMAGEGVAAVILEDAAGERVRLTAPFFLDATDTGELLPLTGTSYVTGAEAQADTGEPHASPGGHRPDEVQSFTYPFAVEYRPGENHTISKPEGYEHFRDAQPYALHLHKETPIEKQFRMFARGDSGELPFWTYRRIFDAGLLKDPAQPNDVALINWAGNDYRFANFLDKSVEEQARILDEAKRLSLGFLYWLQTEAPRDEGGYGYPELTLRPDVMGTSDGLAKAPYIRESRRIKGLERVLEPDLLADLNGDGRGARAKTFSNAVAIGWYPLDLHPSVGNAEVVMYAPTLPFQIPLGALIPEGTTNLLASCKNIGATHLSNGATRLHPVEWAVGEAAGVLAAYCLQKGCEPREVWASEALTRELQQSLLVNGAPLAWTVDVPPEHPLFVPAQRLVLAGAIHRSSPRFHSLELRLDEPLSQEERAVLVGAASSLPVSKETAKKPVLSASTLGELCAEFFKVNLI